MLESPLEIFRDSYNKMRVKYFSSKRKRIKSTKCQFTWPSSKKIRSYISFCFAAIADFIRIFVLSMRRSEDTNSTIGQLVMPKVLLSVFLI